MNEKLKRMNIDIYLYVYCVCSYKKRALRKGMFKKLIIILRWQSLHGRILTRQTSSLKWSCAARVRNDKSYEKIFRRPPYFLITIFSRQN